MRINHIVLIISLSISLLLTMTVSCKSQSEVPIEPQPPTLEIENNEESESIAITKPAPEPEPEPEPIPEPEPEPTPEPEPEPTPEPIPSYQRIESVIKAGYSVGAYVTYTGELEAGDNITGFAQVGGEYARDPNTKWYFQIVDPDGNIERSWLGCSKIAGCDYTTQIDFDHVVSMSGLYSIRVISNSYYSLNMFIKIAPEEWLYSKKGTAKNHWLVTK